MKPLSKESRKKYISWARSVGKALREVRNLRGMTQAGAAKMVGLSAVHLCNVESGESVPSPRVLFSLCEFYGVTPGMLYVLADEPQSVHMEYSRRCIIGELSVAKPRKAKA